MVIAPTPQSKILALDVAQAGANVLTKAYLLEHLRSLNLLFATTVTVGGRVYNYSQVCETVSDADPTCKVQGDARAGADGRGRARTRGGAALVAVTCPRLPARCTQTPKREGWRAMCCIARLPHTRAQEPTPPPSTLTPCGSHAPSLRYVCCPAGGQHSALLGLFRGPHPGEEAPSGCSITCHLMQMAIPVASCECM